MKLTMLGRIDNCFLLSYSTPADSVRHLVPQGLDLVTHRGRAFWNVVLCHVLDMRTIRPLDVESIMRSLKQTGRIVVVDQSWPFASVASEVVAQVCERGFDYLDHQPIRVNSDDVPVPYAKALEAAYLPNKGKIMSAVKKTMGLL